MEYLTPHELRKAAPAAKHLPRSSETLVDTADFIKHVDLLGFRPVFATQGTPHGDSARKGDPAHGRHLVICAKPAGEAVFLLNSHTVARKAWLGIGFYERLAVRPTEGGWTLEPLIGAAIPLPRWRGFEDPLAELSGYWDGVREARIGLHQWSPGTVSRRSLAQEIASTAYLPGHKTPSAALFQAHYAMMAWDQLLHAMEVLRQGNLEPATPGRRVKPIKGPDALFHAANAVFNAGVRTLRSASDTEYMVFPRYVKT